MFYSPSEYTNRNIEYESFSPFMFTLLFNSNIPDLNTSNAQKHSSAYFM